MGSPRLRRVVAAVALVVAMSTLGALLARPRIEAALAARLERAAARRGLRAHAETIRLGLWPLLRMARLRIEKPGRLSLTVDALEWTPRIGAWRMRLGEMRVSAGTGPALVAGPSAWDVHREAGGFHATLRAPVAGLTISAASGSAFTWTVGARDLPATGWLSVRQGYDTLLDPGILTGNGRLASAAGSVTFEADVRGRSVRTASLSEDVSVLEPAFGAPADAHIELEGIWHEADHTLRIRRGRLDAGGAAITATAVVTGLGADPEIEASVIVERADFARLLATSGVTGPDAADGALGSASLSAQVKGRLADAQSFTVTQDLDFTPPKEVPPALARLRGDFRHDVAAGGSERRSVEVGAASPDFVALRDVPPLFVRTLLIAEDAGFFGHRGIDLSALPSAVLTNWAQGRAARGGSTITQQLAKNLFLSRDKRLGRKLQELSLALLLEATLGKERILEIYLNVIEWGPDLYGLRPAARHYFAKEPVDLSPAEGAFLVSLVPGPRKYQASFTGGVVSPGFRRLVDTLLAKLRSVSALTEDEYQAALGEALSPGPRPIDEALP